MIRIQTGSRLHLGVLHLGTEETWPNLDGEPALRARRFGGVGLMLAQPRIELALRRAGGWSASGPLAERALAFARQIAGDAGVGPHELTVVSAPPEHVGLGTGTQLGLAVARGLMESEGLPAETPDLALLVDRGGGFLVEGGKSSPDSLAPLLVGMEFPSDWTVLVIRPLHFTGTHGTREQEAFANLSMQTHALAATDAQCRLVLLGMLSALVERDVRAFGEALYDFNCRSGEMFAPVQGGVYSHPAAEGLIAWLRRHGLAGTGQSSWGPTLFAVAGSPDQAGFVRDRFLASFSPGDFEVTLASAAAGGVRVERNGQGFPMPAT
jgi:beta-RFAP synthase